MPSDTCYSQDPRLDLIIWRFRTAIKEIAASIPGVTEVQQVPASRDQKIAAGLPLHKGDRAA